MAAAAVEQEELSGEVLLDYKGGFQGVSADGLRCRVPGVQRDFPATYDSERTAFCCKVPAGMAASGGACDVVDAGGKVVCGGGQDKDDGKGADATTATKPETFRQRYSALKPFVIISVSYLLYTTTDGAIRMIVLLNAYNLGFSAWNVAIMFTAYELAGVFTNLAAGMMGAKWGIKTTLLTGLTLQVAGIGMLFAWQDSWSEPGQKYKAILFVTFAQMLCGIAKDLTKLGGKTVTKLVTPDEKQSRLFKLVSLITGWKNSLKGVGYFIGAACVSYNYYFALGILLLLIFLAMPWAAISLSNDLGRARSKNLRLIQIFQQKYNVNVLSVSRYFLFGSRDMWFEVPLPFFLRDTVQGLGWSRPITGLFLALWIIVYGQIQSWTPQLFLQPLRQSPANSLVALFWCAVLVAFPIFMGGMVQSSPVFLDRNLGAMQAVIIAGLTAFCIVFAINSSVHSYLIVKYADGDKVAMNIGAYYAANAMGRLTGTLVSGALYSFVDGGNVLMGFAACFWASAGFALASALVDFFLKDKHAGLNLGPCLTLAAPAPAPSAPSAPSLDGGPTDAAPAGSSVTLTNDKAAGAVAAAALASTVVAGGPPLPPPGHEVGAGAVTVPAAMDEVGAAAGKPLAPEEEAGGSATAAAAAGRRGAGGALEAGPEAAAGLDLGSVKLQLAPV